MRAPRLSTGVVLIATLLVGVIITAAAQAAPGDLDPMFSGDGKQTTDFGHFADGGAGMALAAYGRIVVVGQTGGGDFALARYNPTGSLDPTFSGDGKLTTDFGQDPDTGGDGAAAVAIQPNGKIVAVGYTGGGGALARYNPNGSLDPTFSGDGKLTTNTGGETAVAIQPNGKIVVAGGAIARYNPNGSLDPTFSGDGKLTTKIGASAVAIRPNGKIVVAGGGGFNFVVDRYNPNGSRDTSFSGDGRQVTDFGGYDRANGVALQGNGKIVAVGFAQLGDFALARYNPNGLLDPTFSGDGKQRTDFGGQSDGASGVAIQGDGKIVAVGCACSGTGVEDFALTRYNPNGLLDPTYSGDGKLTTDFGLYDRANGVALQGDGKIVAVGRGGPGGDFALARYLGG